MGRLDDAQRFLERADRLLPGDAEILQHLGELYLKKSDHARAIDAYQRALGHDPDGHLRQVIEEQLLMLERGRLAVGSGSH
jgi:tetratricopeptide (TPR) repeat protein